MRLKKFLLLVSCTLLLLGTTYATVAQAQEESGGDNKQTPVQVIVQIVVTAGALKALDRFNLP